MNAIKENNTKLLKNYLSVTFIFSVIITEYTKFLLNGYGVNEFFFFLTLIICFLIISLSKIDKFDIVLLSFSFLILVGGFSPLVFKLVIYCVAAKKCNSEVMIKTHLFTSLSFFIYIIFLWAVGVNYLGEITTYYRDGVIRSALGFKNPNNAFMFTFPILYSLVYLHSKNYKIISIVIIFSSFFSFWVYNETLSRTFVYVLFSGMPTLIIYLGIKKFKFTEKVLFFSPFFFIAITYVVAFHFNNGFFNTLLSSRPNLWFIYLRDYFDSSILNALFGVRFNSSDLEFPLDSSFVFGLIYLGFVPFFYFIYKYSRLFTYLFLSKETLLIVFTLLMFNYSVFETLLFNLAFNPSLILLFKDEVQFIKSPQK
ncbi:hypothetical protein [Aliivibrio sp. S10_S31]|uniref:hypothetical protein n=1 Tax=Aliivibrio sp. S10_S31 TaxID=2720224 RepID=UPI001680EDD3|nr:hypothetical protein [Aliivibrio sp. S10_S31]MBD1571475.1 hypothetical protein [Aliivibrio sp. S10_S31]